MNHSVAVWLLALCVGCQCGDSRLVTRQPPAPDTPDASLTIDSGAVDDAGSPSGERDAGFDAGFDGGRVQVDAGSDGGADGGADGGTDGGVPDASVPDAGPSIDGGCVEGHRRCTSLQVEHCLAGEYRPDPSAIGCEFSAAILGHQLFGYFGGNSFGVTLANPGTAIARVTIAGGMLTAPRVVSIGPGGVSVEALGDRNPRLAFSISSTEPIEVVQFNPLHAVVSGTRTYSCDSSLLRPVQHWGTSHVVASWPHFETTPGLIGVTTRAATRVTITPRAAISATALTPAMPANVATSFTLDAGLFVELPAPTGDLTGSLVDAEQPIQVFGGHLGAKIPATVDAADRLEEPMPPITRLATEYVVVAAALPSIPAGKPQIVRIIAAEAPVTLSFDPPQLGVPTSIASVGDFIEIPASAASYRVSANKKVLVAQYMQSQGMGGNMGDPAMLLPVPRDQWLDRYVFHAPTDYTATMLDVIAPSAVTVTLDGAPLAAGTPIGTTGLSLTRVISLGAGPGGNGNHIISSTAPFTLSISGFGDYTSYWHPG